MPVFFLGALVSLIGGIFVSIGNVILDVVRAVMPIVRDVFDVIRLVVDNIGRNAGRFFRFIASSARGIYSGLVRPVIASIQTHYEKFKTFLRETFDPVIRIFDAVHDFMDVVWRRIVSPVLSAIDKIRAGARLLAGLGVPFAGQLDQILQRIQREIYDRFRTVQNWVNTASFWFDVLLDPRGWVRATPWLHTLYRYAGNVVNIVTKLADIEGLNFERNEAFKRETERKDITAAAERFRAGDLTRDFGIQTAVARFRQGESGRFEHTA